MTWTAHCTVQGIEIDHDAARIEVTLTADAGETYTSQRVVRYEGDNDQHVPVYEPVELPCVVSNTEGAIRSVAVVLQLDQEETALKVGDTVMVSGHFQGTPAT